VRPGSLLLTGADDPVERSFQKMVAVQAVSHITEPDGTPSFTIFESTQATPFLFDGTYSAQVSPPARPAVRRMYVGVSRHRRRTFDGDARGRQQRRRRQL
jgi:hypothetical protein